MEKIGEKALKMACLQVVPGTEFFVVEDLQKGCEALKTPYLVLKGLGYYDIFLIYESPSFEPFLTNCGPIRNILNSNVFNCFSYLGQHAEAMFEKLQDATFVGVSLLKLNPLASTDMFQIELSLAEYLNANLQKNWFVLGTLGWNELVLLIKSNDFSLVAQKLFELNYDQGNTPGQLNYLLKTFSTIGINHKKLPSPQPDQTLLEIEKELLMHQGLKDEIGQHIIPSISIASRPIYYKEIVRYWREKGFVTVDLIGRYDIMVKSSEKISWANLLAHILRFRYEFRNQIHSTFTNIGLNDNIATSELRESDPATETHLPSEPSKNIVSKMLKGYNIEESEKLLGLGNSRKLAKYFFSLISAIQNPTHGDAFWDMADYYGALINFAKTLGTSQSTTEEKTPEELFLNATDNISRGAAVRQYGIYGSHEGLPGDLSFVGGGVQRALLALEYIPSHVLRRIKSLWYGFLIAEDPKFAHYNEIIVVPFSDLWRPNSWWQIYHEIGHIIESRTSLIRFEGPNRNPVVEKFIHDLPEQDRELYRKLLLELTAEVLGFLLGFFGDIDFFINNLWTLLKRLSSLPTRLDYIGKYVIRSFFVEMFYRLFLKTPPDPGEQFTTQSKAKEQLLLHLEKIETSGFDLGDKHEREFFACYHASSISKLYHIAVSLNQKIKELELSKQFSFSPHKADEDSELDKTVDEILNGRMWPHGIKHPEYLLYRLLKEGGDLSFSSKIATVLTFWNASIKHLKNEFAIGTIDPS